MPFGIAILRPFVILCRFYHHLVYLFPVLVRCTKRNLATLELTGTFATKIRPPLTLADNLSRTSEQRQSRS
jgi:hypothetical protein